MSAEPTIAVSDNPSEHRYEIAVDGEPAGLLRYRLEPGQIALIHTEIVDRFEGRGLGGRLIAHALDDARSRGLAVLPFCPFANAYVKRHPEYVELVPAGRRGEFGL